MLVAFYSPKGTYDGIFLANYAYINLVDQLTRVRELERAGLRRGTIRDALVGEAGSTREARHHRARNRQAVQTQNTVNPAGQIGGQPMPRPEVHLHSAGPGTIGNGGGVRRNHLARESGWFDCAPERRRPHRTRRANLQLTGR